MRLLFPLKFLRVRYITSKYKLPKPIKAVNVTKIFIATRTIMIPIIVTVVLIKFNTGAITPLVTVVVFVIIPSIQNMYIKVQSVILFGQCQSSLLQMIVMMIRRMAIITVAVAVVLLLLVVPIQIAQMQIVQVQVQILVHCHHMKD